MINWKYKKEYVKLIRDENGLTDKMRESFYNQRKVKNRPDIDILIEMINNSSLRDVITKLLYKTENDNNTKYIKPNEQKVSNLCKYLLYSPSDKIDKSKLDKDQTLLLYNTIKVWFNI